MKSLPHDHPLIVAYPIIAQLFPFTPFAYGLYFYSLSLPHCFCCPFRGRYLFSNWKYMCDILKEADMLVAKPVNILINQMDT